MCALICCVHAANVSYARKLVSLQQTWFLQTLEADTEAETDHRFVYRLARIKQTLQGIIEN